MKLTITAANDNHLEREEDWRQTFESYGAAVLWFGPVLVELEEVTPYLLKIIAEDMDFASLEVTAVDYL